MNGSIQKGICELIENKIRLNEIHICKANVALFFVSILYDVYQILILRFLINPRYISIDQEIRLTENADMCNGDTHQEHIWLGMATSERFWIIADGVAKLRRF